MEGHEMYGKIFAEAMSFDQTENAFLLIPGKFKENVVQNCGLDYTRNEVLPSTISPSISGQGAMNEYDGVPCLKLVSWPREALGWIHRQNRSDVGFQMSGNHKLLKISHYSWFQLETQCPRNRTCSSGSHFPWLK